MWLYVPYQSAQDTQELNSESPQWQMLSRSATWKETWRKPLSWYRAFGRDSYLKLLSGVTLKPSTLSRGVAEWISSLEVSPVSHFRSLEATEKKPKRQATSEIYGPTLLDSQGNLGTQLSFAKMFPESFDTTGTLSNQSFKEWATALRKDSTLRLKQALHTEGSGYSLWPTVTQDSATMRDKPYAQGGTPLTLEAANWRTPTSMESGLNPERVGEFQWGQRNYDKETGRLAQTGLTQQVKVWPTPTLGGKENRASKAKRGSGGEDLAARVENWMTPNTMDALPPKSQEALDHEHQTARPGRATPNNLRDQASVQAGMTFWPTPATRDHKGFDSPGKKNAHQDPAMYLYSHLLPETPPDGSGSSPDTPDSPQHIAKRGICSPACRRLNPNFAAWLMGLPPGWLTL